MLGRVRPSQSPLNVVRNSMKRVFYILTLSILTLSCRENRKSVTVEKYQNDEADSLTNPQSKKARPSIDKDTIASSLIKFEPHVGFNDFKVSSIDHKKYADLDLQSNREAVHFRTQLQEGYQAKKANFAGHYTFVDWGCGSPCQSSLLIDRTTGRIYDSPTASLGYEFRIDSRMLIVNPPDSTGFYEDCYYCKPIIYIFDEQTKTFNERPRR